MILSSERLLPKLCCLVQRVRDYLQLCQLCLQLGCSALLFLELVLFHQQLCLYTRSFGLLIGQLVLADLQLELQVFNLDAEGCTLLNSCLEVPLHQAYVLGGGQLDVGLAQT